MKIVNVGMSQIEMTTSPGTILVAPSLGSCIGLAAFDKKSKMAGMAHIVLPDSTASSKEIEQIGKYANIAVPALLERMLSLGCKKENLTIKIAGGAQMFNLQKGANILNIGLRNTIAVKAAISNLGLKLTKADTGGNKGRTFKLNVMEGKFYIKTIGSEEIEF